MNSVQGVGRPWYSLGNLTGFLRNVLTATMRRGLFISAGKRFQWTGVNVAPYKHFQESEVTGLDPAFVSRLDLSRDRAGVPFVITSGKRNPVDNATAGGVSDSAHLEGLAVDLRVRDHHSRGLIVKALYAEGFNRIGVYRDTFGNPTHVHVDASMTLPQDELWDGVSH